MGFGWMGRVGVLGVVAKDGEAVTADGVVAEDGEAVTVEAGTAAAAKASVAVAGIVAEEEDSVAVVARPSVAAVADSTAVAVVDSTAVVVVDSTAAAPTAVADATNQPPVTQIKWRSGSPDRHLFCPPHQNYPAISPDQSPSSPIHHPEPSPKQLYSPSQILQVSDSQLPPKDVLPQLIHPACPTPDAHEPRAAR